MIVTRISTTKDYNAYSNIVDMILVTLAKMTTCFIKVYYEYHGAIDNHQINPIGGEYKNTIEVSLVCRHYDLIIKSVIPKMESSEMHPVTTDDHLSSADNDNISQINSSPSMDSENENQHELNVTY